jgi:hypothetical protein
MANATSSERTLALVAASLGFVGSVLIASVVLGSREVGVSTLFVVCTTVVASQLGRFAARHIEDATVFAGATVVAGMANGTLLALVAAVMVGGSAAFALLLFGAVFGGGCALPFMPALLVAFHTSRRVGRSRDGSLLDAADRRAPWMATSITVLLIGTLAVSHWPEALNAPVFLCLFVAMLAALAYGVRSVSDWQRARAFDADIDNSVPCDGCTPEVAGGAEAIDFGVGDDERECHHRGDAYRAGTRAVRRFKGDRQAAHEILTRDLVFGMLGIVTAGLMVFRVALALSAEASSAILW